MIVESPTKAGKIAGYLGSGYVVEASVGHIRDLPRNAADVPAAHKGESWARLGVDVDNGFEPLYVVSPDRRQQVSRLKQLVKDASEVYLATDEDREGEAIAWHLVDTLKPRVPVRRMVFHEITPEAITRAVANPRELDTALVDAQETRRILDRLYGYEVSPVLWKKVLPKLSAGRVQSVATRIVVERERERMAFTAADYWSLEGTFAVAEQRAPPTRASRRPSAPAWSASTTAGSPPAATSTRADRPGRPATSCTSTRPAPAALAARLEGRQVTRHPRRREALPRAVPTRRSPPRRCRWRPAASSAGPRRRTMRVAQRLYENGHITYMRTDSTNLSDEAINAARSQARELYGDAFVPAEPRRYKSKAKGAQEAHEAIRPAGDSFRTPGQLRRQLGPRRVPALRAGLAAHRGLADGRRGRADREHPAGRAQRHRRGASSSPPAAAPSPSPASCGPTSSRRTRAPRRRRRARAATTPSAGCRGSSAASSSTPASSTPKGHTTSPPSRYTEPSLVARLEELGIGRPVDLRLDHADHPGPRVRLEEGRGAGARPSSPSP